VVVTKNSSHGATGVKAARILDEGGQGAASVTWGGKGLGGKGERRLERVPNQGKSLIKTNLPVGDGKTKW